MKSFTAGPNDDGVRLSRFVQRMTVDMPASVLYKGFRTGRMKVNGKKAGADTRLKTGDIIDLYIVDAYFPVAGQVPPQRKHRPVTVLWEDDNIAFLYKPAHVLCHADRTGDASLIDDFIARQASLGEYDAEKENNFTPALCNRLDRGTEGILIAAKNYTALRDMNAVIRDNLVDKRYYCITIGTPKNGVHNAYLCHDSALNSARVSAGKAPGSKPITTGVKVLKSGNGLALCEIRLFTGRTHQIRAHLAFLGCPVAGDKKYGKGAKNHALGLTDQALCAFSLTFDEIPPENTLSYLSGRTFALPAPDILSKYDILASLGTKKPASGESARS